MNEKQMLHEMGEVIDQTHWTKNALACVNVLYETDAAGKVLTEDYKPRWGDVLKVPIIKLGEDGKPMIKPTACLVGIILVVERGGWGELKVPSLVTAKSKVRRSIMEESQKPPEFPLAWAGKGFDEAQLSDTAHAVIRLLLIELNRAPAKYKYPNEDSTKLDRDRMKERLREHMRVDCSDTRLLVGVQVNSYRDLEEWNDAYETDKKTVRLLVQTTHDRIKE